MKTHYALNKNQIKATLLKKKPSETSATTYESEAFALNTTQDSNDLILVDKIFKANQKVY